MNVSGNTCEYPVLNNWRKKLFVMAFAACVVYLLGVNIALAAETIGSQAQSNQVQNLHFPVVQIFTFLLLMLGPFKIIGSFAKVTRGVNAAVANRIALLSMIFASLALLLAGLLGNSILSNLGIPVPILALSGGIILFLVALKEQGSENNLF
ncbi:MAG: MarC family protein [Gammaproteobacteria bacterium]|nr:MarC family protein [Gammaproteobacteria bacterium]MDX2486276.1 MarC family protein [Gammaproteobacteria bacterium]